MIKVQNNDIKSINAALLSIQNKIKNISGINNEIREKTTVIKTTTESGNNDNLEISINNLNNRINSLVSNLEIINENLNTVTNKVNSLIPYPGNYIQSVEEAKKEAIEEAVAQSGEVDLSSLPHYIGPYDADNIPVNADCNKGDWYFNTTDIKLYINNYDTDTELYSWDEIPLTKENEYMYNSASKDILNYADDTGNIGTFATAYISHLFAQKITVTDSVQSSNYSETEGFKLDGETGDIFANNGFFRGVIATPVLVHDGNFTDFYFDISPCGNWETIEPPNEGQLINNRNVWKYTFIIVRKYTNAGIAGQEYNDISIGGSFTVSFARNYMWNESSNPKTREVTYKSYIQGSVDNNCKLTNIKNIYQDGFYYWCYGRYTNQPSPELQWVKSNSPSIPYFTIERYIKFTQDIGRFTITNGGHGKVYLLKEKIFEVVE